MMGQQPVFSSEPSSEAAAGPFKSSNTVIRRFLRHRPATMGLVILAVIGLASALAPVIAPYPLGVPNYSAILSPPSFRHLMGTDDIGADVFTEVLYGGRVSMLIGLASAVLAVGVGGVVGSVAGYFGGVVDMVLMRLVDVALSIPILFVLLLLSIIFGATPITIIAIIGGTSWMAPARLLRAQFLTVRERDYVEAARASGASNARIILRQILPNAVAPLIVNATVLVGQAILLAAVMSFLGLGIQPPYISWGYILNTAQSYFTSAPWMSIFPGAMIFLVVLSVNLVGDGLRDSLDPTSRRQPG